MTIGIIGYGNFGSFLHRLSTQHLPQANVVVFSSRSKPDGKTFVTFEDACKADIVIPAVSISTFAETLERMKPFLGGNTIVADVCTVKVMPVEALRRAGVRFIATHPMFGPESFEKHGGNLRGLRLVVCDHTLSTETYARFLEWTRTLGIVVIECSADRHDRDLANTLFLTHLISQSMIDGTFERTAIDTPSFGFLMDAVESVRRDKELFKDVYRYNPYCKEALERFKTSLREVEESLNG